MIETWASMMGRRGEVTGDVQPIVEPRGSNGSKPKLEA